MNKMPLLLKAKFYIFFFQVRITYLHVEKSSMEQIKLGNSAGSIKLDELKRPVFYHSKPLNFMKKEDRRVLFKALLLIKLMQLKYEKGSA